MGRRRARNTEPASEPELPLEATPPEEATPQIFEDAAPEPESAAPITEEELDEAFGVIPDPPNDLSPNEQAELRTEVEAARAASEAVKKGAEEYTRRVETARQSMTGIALSTVAKVSGYSEEQVLEFVETYRDVVNQRPGVL